MNELGAGARATMKKLAIALTLASILGCGDVPPETSAPPPERPADTPANASAESPDGAIRVVVESFGESLRNVSLLAPPEMVSRSVKQHYGDFVTGGLLRAWMSTPEEAPGRTTSSPWPERIAILEIHAPDRDQARVFGEIVEVTSADSVVRRVPVSIGMTRVGRAWRISRWSPATPLHPATEPDSSGAAAVIEAYYAAIDASDHARAFELWEQDGRASGQTRDEFTVGFAETADVEIETGSPGRVEGAAGSRWIEIPVEIHATTRSGEEQRFRGTYTLRRSVVDGATLEQRGWRIASAKIEPAV